MAAQEADIYALVLGRVVSHVRESRGWSQAALAESVGITQPTLSRIERGQVLPDVYTFRRIALAYDTTPGELWLRVEDALGRTENAARGAVGSAARGAPLWQAALAAAGSAGLAGLVAFAVASALDGKRDPRKPPSR